ncbi:aconitase family protein [Exophiala viscosa]|uniref:Aconitase family protein n=1 Tax=Exophiala viscosa TaxID=2486360 RepID=A0AAN6DQC4_9EURO|nr:aconitase family protein [Exophiala viscosa]
MALATESQKNVLSPEEGQPAQSILGPGLQRLLSQTRKVRPDDLVFDSSRTADTIPGTLSCYISALTEADKPAEAEALQQVYDKVVDSPSFGGLGLTEGAQASAHHEAEAVFLVEAWLNAITSRERARDYLSFLNAPAPGTRPMTLAEKIFAQHVLGEKSTHGLKAGDVVRVGVDWILASELSWQGMDRTHKELGSPGIWRNDRFWLAGDHVYHPALASNPKIKSFLDVAEKAKNEFKMTEYQGMNYTIMHTEFVRERVEPGMLAIGSDSHTCSGGAVGSLSLGLGTADVMMALALGETWFRIPESISIELVGKPGVGMTGKDVILNILGELKRNTVAAERIVEFTGDGLKYLSCDARFAICNMCTEFGAISGIFVPDSITRDYIARRRRKTNRQKSLYFKPDADAGYAGKYTIDLARVEASVAVYPNPDDVVPVSRKAGLKLDGVFIGACTTTEEELVLAALVLKVGLDKGLPIAKGKRHYVPGSLPVLERLKELGLLEVYEAAGFTRGPPGCSFCVGLSAEKANEGETWLSSQNRNFQNRMGKGAFGHVTTAIVCAASSFSLTITSPAEFLRDIDLDFFRRYSPLAGMSYAPIEYVEPDLTSKPGRSIESTTAADTRIELGKEGPQKMLDKISSKVVTLGDFIDTDALAPGPTLTTCVTDEDFGHHVLEHTHPEFRAKVKGGQQIVVAGHAFGVGSSRECAVSALKGAGVKAVLARSFAFIYGRNQPSLGLLGITVSDDAFFEAAKEGEDITIDIPSRSVTVGGQVFPFNLSEMEYNLTINNGMAESFRKFGKGIWENFTGTKTDAKSVARALEEGGGEKKDRKMEW